MKKSIILILLFIIFANFNKVYANGIAALNKDNGITIKKNKKITLESFYTNEINETNIKEQIIELKEDSKENEKFDNFMEKMIDILEDLYNNTTRDKI